MLAKNRIFGMFAPVLVLLLVATFAKADLIIFNEKVTDGTLDESWYPALGTSSDTIVSDKSVSPDYSMYLGPLTYDAGTKYANFSLPEDSYTLTAHLATTSGNPDRRPKLIFNQQNINAVEGSGYELVLYAQNLLLGRRDSGGWAGTLGSKSGLANVLTDGNFHKWSVSVQWNGTANEIRVYIDDNLITWDGGTYSGHSVALDSVYRGGTFAFGNGGSDTAVWADNITVSTIPEPGVATLLMTSILGLLAYAWRKRK